MIAPIKNVHTNYTFFIVMVVNYNCSMYPEISRFTYLEIKHLKKYTFRHKSILMTPL
jgi:hypothetical protein